MIEINKQEMGSLTPITKEECTKSLVSYYAALYFDFSRRFDKSQVRTQEILAELEKDINSLGYTIKELDL